MPGEVYVAILEDCAEAEARGEGADYIAKVSGCRFIGVLSHENRFVRRDEWFDFVTPAVDGAIFSQCPVERVQEVYGELWRVLETNRSPL